MVSIENKATGARMNAIRQFLFYNPSTSRTPLARVARINEYHGSSSFFRFEGRELHELIPGNVTNAFIKFMSNCVKIKQFLPVYKTGYSCFGISV